MGVAGQGQARKRQTVGESIIQGLNEAIAWTRGESTNVRVTLVHIPQVDVRKVRTRMGLSQSEFATKFGLPPATLRNWEQGRSRPDAQRACCWRSSPSIPRRWRMCCGGRVERGGERYGIVTA